MRHQKWLVQNHQNLQTWRHLCPWVEPPAHVESAFERFGPAARNDPANSRPIFSVHGRCHVYKDSKPCTETTEFESTSHTCYIFDIHTVYTPCQLSERRPAPTQHLPQCCPCHLIMKAASRKPRHGEMEASCGKTQSTRPLMLMDSNGFWLVDNSRMSFG